MNERKQIIATAIDVRGQKLKTIASDAITPMTTIAVSAQSRALIQNSDGMIQYARAPATRFASCRYSIAGRMPRSPMSP